MRRTDRLYALVEELRARAPRPISRNELADRLEVTPRTVERDILALQQAGVPIWSQRGRGGGYAIDARWSLPPLNFEATEALAVIAALATTRSMPFAEAGRRAERKLLAAMTVGEAAKARALAARVRLGSFGTPATQQIVAAVEQAVVERRVVDIDYRDRDGAVTRRPVEAHGLHLSTNGSYLVGWCRLRDAGRAFRLDRIVSVRDTGEIAPEREIDALVDWVDDAVAPHTVTEGATMPAKKPSRGNWGPARRVDNRTGSGAGFARAIAGALPDVTAKAGRGRTSFRVGDHEFLVVADGDESMVVRGPGDSERSYLLPTIGRDDTVAVIEEAWSALVPKGVVTAHARRRQQRAKEPAVTHDDIRSIVLALPGATEGPIWGQDIGFLIGTEKKTRFARFGPPVGGRVGNLLPPDDLDTLVILRCPQRAELLAASPERYFFTAHYGRDPAEPGGVIVRLPEFRGREGREELAEVLEDAWRAAAPPELVAELDDRRGTRRDRSPA